MLNLDICLSFILLVRFLSISLQSKTTNKQKIQDYDKGNNNRFCR